MGYIQRLKNRFSPHSELKSNWSINLSAPADMPRSRLVVFTEQAQCGKLLYETAAFMGLSLRASGGRVLFIEVRTKSTEAGKWFNVYHPNVAEILNGKLGVDENLLSNLTSRKEGLNLDLVLANPTDLVTGDVRELNGVYATVLGQALDKYGLVIVDATNVGPELDELKRWLYLSADINLTSRYVASPKADAWLPPGKRDLRPFLEKAAEFEAWPAGEGPWVPEEGRSVALFAPTLAWLGDLHSGRALLLTPGGYPDFNACMLPLAQFLISEEPLEIHIP